MSSKTLHVIHFNDVYKMTRFDKIGGKERPRMDEHGLIDTPSKFDQILAFTDKIQEIRDKDWVKNSSQEPQGLLLFSGDLFSPSVESVLTRGRNMVHLMNELAPDACVPGNHEFDFGRERFDRLIEFSNFVWVLSNVIERPIPLPGRQENLSAGKTLPGLKKYHIIKRVDLTIGVIGLMSKNAWNSTNTQSKERLDLLDMAEVCKDLAETLREKEKCDLVFALTHAEHDEDVELARRVGAYPANAPMLQRSGEALAFTDRGSEKLLNGETLLENIPGVDVIFGGHNHDYFLGQGVKLEGSPGPSDVYKPRFQRLYDDDLLIVKSGFDFNDLSQVTITIEDRPNGAKRKKVITSLTVARHNIKPRAPDVQAQPKSSMACVLGRQFEHEVLTGAEAVVGVTKGGAVFNIEPYANTKGETVIGNWIADSLLNWFIHHVDKAVEAQDVVFITTGGSIRGDRDIGPGEVLARDIIQLASFETELKLLSVKGEIVKAVLNAALERSDRIDGVLQPSGRFPVVSGMRVEWSSQRPKGDRVEKIYMVNQEGEDTGEMVMGNDYRVLTTAYLAEGNSGFVKFKDAAHLPTNAQLPMFQVLLYHINDLKDISVLDRVQDLENEYKAIPDKDRTGEQDQTLAKIERVKSFLRTTSDLDRNDKWGSLPHAAKYFKDALFANSSEADLPVLDIKLEIDNRMKDNSAPRSSV